MPKSIVILGSGPIGVEFATIFKRFGSEVTVIELLPHLVPLEDEAISVELEKSFKKQGIAFHTSATVTAARALGRRRRDRREDARREVPDAQGRVPARGDRPRPRDRRASAPRKPASRWTSGYVVVDEQFRTNVPNVSAIGDVITFGRPGTCSWRTCRRPKASPWPSASPGRDFHPINYDHVPKCTYCDPEIGSVGLTEKQAKERGYDVRVGTFNFGVLGRARIANETDGFVKIVAEKKYDEILGVHMIGPRSTELVAEATLALRLEITVEELIRTIHAHPTMSEAVGEAAHAVHGAAIHA